MKLSGSKQAPTGDASVEDSILKVVMVSCDELGDRQQSCQGVRVSLKRWRDARP